MKRLINRVIPHLLILSPHAVLLYQWPKITVDLVIVYGLAVLLAYAISVGMLWAHWCEDLEKAQDEVRSAYQAQLNARTTDQHVHGPGTHQVTSEDGNIVFRSDISGTGVIHTFSPEIARQIADRLLKTADKLEESDQAPPTIWERLDQ